MNPAVATQMLKMLVGMVPSTCADPDGRKILRSVVDLFEGLLYQAKSPYGPSVNPQLHRALQLFLDNIPDAEKHVRDMVDEIKRQLSAFDDHDGVETFPARRLS